MRGSCFHGCRDSIEPEISDEIEPINRVHVCYACKEANCQKRETKQESAKGHRRPLHEKGFGGWLFIHIKSAAGPIIYSGLQKWQFFNKVCHDVPIKGSFPDRTI